MGIFADWRFYLFIIAVLNTIVTSVAFFTIKFNDLKHLSKDVSDMKKEMKETNSKVINIDKILAVQKQRIDVLEKSTK